MKMYHTFLLHLLESHRDCRPKTDTSIGLLLARYSPALAVQGPGSVGASKIQENNPAKKIRKKQIRKLTMKTFSQKISLQKKTNWSIGLLLARWSPALAVQDPALAIPAHPTLPLDFQMSYLLYPVKCE